MSPRARPWLAAVLGTALATAVTVVGDWQSRYPGVAVAAGVLVAVLAGAAGGIWGGLAVGAAGWLLYYFFVADEALRALVGLPAWLAAGALAGGSCGAGVTLRRPARRLRTSWPPSATPPRRRSWASMRRARS